MGPHENQFLLVRSQFAISGRLQIVVTVFLYVSTVSQFKGSDFNRLTGVGFYGNNKMLKSLSLLSLAVAGAVYSTAAFAEEEKIVYVYNWSEYVAEDTIANFEKETGIKVVYDVYDSNEVLEACLEVIPHR